MHISLCRVQQPSRVKQRGLREPLPSLAIMAVLSSLAFTACTPTVATHGHTFDEAAIAQIEPGRSSQQEVMQLLGSPSSLASFDGEVWYYVSQRTEKISFYQEDVVGQDVIAIAFDEQGVVDEVDRHGLEQTAAVEPVDRVTPTAGEAPSIFEQLIGNIGRFGSGGGAVDPDA